MNIITAEITKVNNVEGEFLALFDDNEIRIDVTVGCNIPHDFFDLFNMNKLIGKNYTFEGDWYNGNKKLFLSSAMSVPIGEEIIPHKKRR